MILAATETGGAVGRKLESGNLQDVIAIAITLPNQARVKRVRIGRLRIIALMSSLNLMKPSFVLFVNKTGCSILRSFRRINRVTSSHQAGRARIL